MMGTGPEWYYLKKRFALLEPLFLLTPPPTESMGKVRNVEFPATKFPDFKNTEIELDVLARTVTLPEGAFTVESFLAAARQIKQFLSVRETP